MHRREFCKLLAGAATAAALPTLGQSVNAAPMGAGGFDRYTETFPEFCATPANQRVFYALRGKSIVREKLHNTGWRPTGWGNPPALPVPGGSHDGVPMESPIPNLAGDGPYEPT